VGLDINIIESKRLWFHQFKGNKSSKQAIEHVSKTAFYLLFRETQGNYRNTIEPARETGKAISQPPLNHLCQFIVLSQCGGIKDSQTQYTPPAFPCWCRVRVEWIHAESPEPPPRKQN